MLGTFILIFLNGGNNVSKSDSFGIETNFIGQDKSLYYVNNFETATKGNIYIPQVITNKKTTVTFDDKQLENYSLILGRARLSEILC